MQYSDGDVEQLNLFNETWHLSESAPTSEAALNSLPLRSEAPPAARTQQQVPCVPMATSAQPSLHAAMALSGAADLNAAQPNGTALAAAQIAPQPDMQAMKAEDAATDGRLPASTAQAAVHQADTGICLERSGDQASAVLPQGAGSSEPLAPGQLSHLQGSFVTDKHEAGPWAFHKAGEDLIMAQHGSQAQIAGMTFLQQLPASGTRYRVLRL